MESTPRLRYFPGRSAGVIRAHRASCRQLPKGYNELDPANLPEGVTPTPASCCKPRLPGVSPTERAAAARETEHQADVVDLAAHVRASGAGEYVKPTVDDADAPRGQGWALVLWSKAVRQFVESLSIPSTRARIEGNRLVVTGPSAAAATLRALADARSEGAKRDGWIADLLGAQLRRAFPSLPPAPWRSAHQGAAEALVKAKSLGLVHDWAAYAPPGTFDLRFAVVAAPGDAAMALGPRAALSWANALPLVSAVQEPAQG